MGYAHPDYLLRDITSEQLSEWFAYYKLEPFGEEFDWMKSGVIAATIVNANPFRSKHAVVAKPHDFIPEAFKGNRRKQSVDEMKSILMNIVNYTNGKNQCLEH